jgi:hypothetical protein
MMCDTKACSNFQICVNNVISFNINFLKMSDKDSLMSVNMLVMTWTITKRAHHAKSYEFLTKPIEETL